MAKRMNPQVKGLWLLALRGRHTHYKQGVGYLNKDGCMCVFGVLCDLYRRQHPENEFGTWKEWRPGVYGFGQGENFTYVPDFVLNWAGIDSNRDKLSTPVNQIMGRNDGTVGQSQHDFPRLAEYIDAHL